MKSTVNKVSLACKRRCDVCSMIAETFNILVHFLYALFSLLWFVYFNYSVVSACSAL